MKKQELKDMCEDVIEKEFDHLWGMASYLHENPEVAFQEFKACKVLCRDLREHGFEVEEQAGGLATAFHASYKHGDGPRIAVIAEYDALAKLGHACGHNLIATSALGCAYAVKTVLQQSDYQGSIEVFGTPAEEDGGGKITMLKEHVFDGVDAIYFMHPTSAMTRIGGECASFTDFIVDYKGLSAHAESHPENGINALDAATLCYQAIGLLRQQLKDGIHICCILSKTNEDIGRISDHTRVEIEISTMNVGDIEQTRKKIKSIVDGMALATGCSVTMNEIPGYLGRTPNTILSNVLKDELHVLQEPVMDGLPSDKGGEDLGNVSRCIPACNLFMTLLPEKKISGHTEQFRDLSISQAGKKCLNISSKAMARAILQLFEEPSKIVLAKEELQRRIHEEDELYGK